MSQDDQLPPSTADEAEPVDAAIDDLLSGVAPANMVHGAIELGYGGVGADGLPRAGQASVEAARLDILAALWGANW